MDRFSLSFKMRYMNDQEGYSGNVSFAPNVLVFDVNIYFIAPSFRIKRPFYFLAPSVCVFEGDTFSNQS